jgi:gliding motility-associated lipoprotein GldJ
MKLRNVVNFFVALAAISFLNSCSENLSPSTGWEYNNPDNGGFEVAFDYYEQETGPGLVLVEGGSFTMGRVEEDVLYDWNSVPRKVTVSSFYMDETEVRNVDYREYLYWLKRVFVDYPEVRRRALPDTLVWRSRLGYNEPFVEYYFRHPAYQNYPVVGVNWLQSNDYCAWRTDRVNEMILIREGILNPNPNQTGEDNFNSDAYLAKQYEGDVRQDLQDLDPNNDTRKVRLEDGILLPKYRLPTEAEWEFAATALIGSTVDERIFERKMYPWSGHHTRNPNGDDRGKMMANFVRGRGDYMGVAGSLNDNADVTAPVLSYWPNDYGLYCMAGNVNEWVQDVYRANSFDDFDEFRPFRGNIFQTVERDEEGNVAEKDSLGRLKYRDVTEEEAFDRRNYRKSDNVNYLDGDFESSLEFANEDGDKGPGSNRMYQQGKGRDQVGIMSMVNDHARVYKGGSWKDRAYWMTPGSRRFLDEKQSANDIGFRCAMIRVGSPQGF